MFNRIITLFVFVFVLGIILLPQTAMSAVSRSGFGKGGFLNDLVYNYDGVPLLSDFYFRYTKSDHHITNIVALPERFTRRIDIMYSDKNQDDEYFYRVGHEERTSPSIFRNRAFTLFCKGSCKNQPIQRPTGGNYVFVLVGFSLSYRDKDHHIDEIGIREHDGQIDVHFNDKNDDDSFIARVDYAYVPMSEIRSQGVVSGRNDRGGARRTIAEGIPVISGFHFNFNSKDHHLKDIGVITYSDHIDVFYGDKNQDDRFSWNVRYATLRNPVICCFQSTLDDSPLQEEVLR